MRHFRFVSSTLFLLVMIQCAFSLPVRILATGDMHGRLEPTRLDGRWLGGAAEMLDHWKQTEQYTPESFLVLSCGDIATGPAISTIFQGMPVIDAMNAMGYDASTLGNHDFDFKQQQIMLWQQQARFPFLAANLTDTNGNPSSLAIPYMFNEEQGVKIAVIGLIMQDIFTYGSADGLTVQPYEATLRKIVPEVRKQGAQVVIVAAHIPFTEMQDLVASVADLHIPVFLAAHDHELQRKKIGESWVVDSGFWWRSYSRIDLDYDATLSKISVTHVKQVKVLQDTHHADPVLADIIRGWQQRIDAEYGTQLLGYLASPLRRPAAAYNFVVDSWLAMDPEADIALTNDGSVRQDMPAGSVTMATIMGMLPFNNSVLRLRMTGEQILAYLQKDKFFGMAGLHYKRGKYILTKSGEPLEPNMTYQVLLNDYMYHMSTALQIADPYPITVFEDWRQPVREWLLAHPTDEEHPLNALVDVTPRGV